MKKTSIIIALTIFLITGIVEFGLSQPPPKVGSPPSHGEVREARSGGGFYFDAALQFRYMGGDTTYEPESCVKTMD
jgi:hypothetical protein